MPLDRETIYQVLVSIGAVAVFVGAAIAVTELFSTNGNISGQGGLALLGAIVLFILVISVAGLWLERQEFDGESS